MATMCATGGRRDTNAVRETVATETVPVGRGHGERVLPRELLQAQKMEAIGHLAGGLAHDLNNHLLVIRGCIELCNLENPEDGVTGDLLRQARLAADRAVELTRQILVFTRQQPRERVILDLNTSIRDIHDLLRRVMEENISLVLDLSDDLWSIEADPTNMDQVITNLMINARDAMPGGGTITIKTENVIQDDIPGTAVPASHRGRFVRLTVSDTGVGIPEDVMPHIFEPFFTTKPNGSGLGLSVVHGIVVAHDGWIQVSSTPGKGTTFEVYLPTITIEARPASRMDGDTRLGDAPRGHGEAVLLIEDDAGVRGLTERVLRDAGYAVHPCASIREAQELCGRLDGRIDLIISDVVLPDGSGRDFVRRFTDTHPSTCVLLVSGYPDGEVSAEASERPGWVFVEKPYTFASLLHEIDRLVRSEKAPRSGTPGRSCLPGR